MMQFPHYQEWLTWMSQRENGLLLIAVIAVAGVSWLLNVRQIMPRLLPAFRIAALSIFYLSALALLVAHR